MSDVSGGPGWWQASDQKWYPPELHPAYRPPPPTTSAGPAASGPPLSISWSNTRWNLIGAAVASALVFLGSFMTWATASIGFLSVSKAGTTGDGRITLVLGIVAFVLAIVALRGGRRGISVAGGVVALLALVVTVIDTANLARLIGRSTLVSVSIGPGLVLVLVGAAIALLAFGRVALHKTSA